MVVGRLSGSAADVLVKIAADTKSYDAALDKAEGSSKSFANKLKAAGPAIALAFGAAAVGFAAMAVKMAAAEEVVSNQTRAMLKMQGIMWNDVGEELDAYMKQLERLTAFNDTDLQIAFNTLIAAGLDYTSAMESMNTVTSMAFTLNRDLNSMAMLVGKAYNGQTGELSRYGIVLDETLDKTEKFAGLQKLVSDNFASADERTETLAGQMDVLKNSMFNVAEAMGAELLPMLVDNMKALNEWGDAGGWDDIRTGFEIISGGIGLAGDALGLYMKYFNSFRESADYMQTVATSGTSPFEIYNGEILDIETHAEQIERVFFYIGAAAENTTTELQKQNNELDEQLSKHLAIEQAFLKSRRGGEAGFISGTGGFERFTPQEGRTFGSQAEVTAARSAGEIKPGDVYTVNITTGDTISSASEIADETVQAINANKSGG